MKDQHNAAISLCCRNLAVESLVKKICEQIFFFKFIGIIFARGVGWGIFCK